MSAPERIGLIQDDFLDGMWAGRVRVRPLEWRSIGRDRVAKTMIGEYVVSLDVFQVGGTAYLWVAGQVDGDDHHSEHENMQAAKAAAQADYEARILAALRALEQGDGKP